MYFIVTAADSRKQAMERTLEDFRGVTSCLSGARKRALSMELVPGIWGALKEAEQWFRHVKWEKRYD
jgi:hypothetical protein